MGPLETQHLEGAGAVGLGGLLAALSTSAYSMFHARNPKLPSSSTGFVREKWLPVPETRFNPHFPSKALISLS